MLKAISGAAVAILTASSLAAQSADMVFTNASVLTMNDANPTAEAVAVSGNRISYVGDANGVQALIGEATEVFDLGGDTLLPGFVSGHDHLIASSWTSRGVDLFGVSSVEEAVAKIKDYADANPNEELILGFGFNRVEYGRWPHKADLDAVISDRPVFILDNTIHDIWMNSNAFEVGGVAPDEPDQVPDVIFWQRDDKGEQTGIGIEFQWAPAFLAAGGWQPDKDIPAIQKDLYNKAAAAGMTSVHVPGLATVSGTKTELSLPESESALVYLHGLEQAGELKMRTFFATMMKVADADPVLYAEFTAKMRKKYDSDMLRVWGIKIHPEGNWSSKTSLMIEPFADGSGSRGGAAVRREQLIAQHLEANKRGLDVGTHVDGSQTTRDTIDAILMSRAAGNTDERNLLHHYFWTTDEDHQRVVDNAIPVNTTPQFSTDWEGQDRNAIAMLGEARVNSMFARYSELMQIGHNVSVSSDIPSSPISMIAPLFNVEIAMTLQDPTGKGSKPFPPSQKPASLNEALKAVTIYPAWQNRMEDKIGTLAVGKLADLVVLDRDITKVAPRDISDIKVLGTVLDGAFTYRDGM